LEERKVIDLRIIKFGLVVILVLGVKAQAFSDEVVLEANKPKKVTQEKTLDGEVVAISPNFIAINYGVDKKTSHEMALVIDKDTKVERKKSLQEIAPGDIVSVKYAEIAQVSKEIVKGEEKSKARVLSRLAKVIRFINPGLKELQSVEESVPVVMDEPKKEGLEK
jgi:hypothetical protein